MAFLSLFVGGTYAAWRWGPEAMSRLPARTREEVVIKQPLESQELAQATLDRFEDLRRGSGPARIALGNVELSSVLKFSLPDLIPALVSHPAVTLADGVLTLSGKVPLDALEGVEELGPAAGFLPDTLLLELEGSLVPFDEHRAALVIHKVVASRFPLPDRMIAGVLRSLGRQPEEGLSVNALVVPLPSGLESAYILRDSLVLLAAR